MPIGAPWTPSMILGAQMEQKARDEYFTEIVTKNQVLEEELLQCRMQMKAANSFAAKQDERILALEDEVRFYREMLIKSEQGQMGIRIWGAQERQPSLWDKGVLSKLEDEHPLTVGKVVSDLGRLLAPSQLHRLSVLVHRAYMHLHGVSPRPRLFYGPDGVPERVCCYTEGDRELIIRVTRESGLLNEPESGGDSTINPVC